MTLQDLLKAYETHGQVFDFSEEIRKAQTGKFRIEGAVAGQPALLLAALWRILHRDIVVVLNDKEEALYFQNDLEQLLTRKHVHVFPASYRRPYQIDETENANILQRAEVLNLLNREKTGRRLIVTYAEALSEQVVTKKALEAQTLKLKKGEEQDPEDIVEFLDEMGFEREDFVYEPGQYAVRGGLVDVFSFAHDLPYRIEFFGDEIEEIRSFDPVTQMTEESLPRIDILPNVQEHFQQEQRISFLEYISSTSLICTRSIEFARADLDRIYEKAEEHYAALQEKSGGGAASRPPEDLYITGKRLVDELKAFGVLEFGTKTQFRADHILSWPGSPQPTFKKEFSLLADHFKQNTQVGITNLVLSSSPSQIKRLEEIFAEIDPEVHFQGIKGELHEGFLDKTLRTAVYTDHQIFQRYHRYRSRSAKERSQAITLKELAELNPGDFVTHISHGIGKFAGLHTIEVGNHRKEAVKIIYKGGDAIFVDVNALHKVAKYSGKEGTQPKLNKLGTPTWNRSKSKAKKRIKELAFDLVDLYAKRKATKGFAFHGDDYLQRELEASFMYEDTPDQEKATADVKADMEKPFPMDRLVCGDVGFGKTEVAIRAAFKAAVSGKQVAVLAPTTILTLQHHKTFQDRLSDFPVKVDYLNRFKTGAAAKETLQRLADGKIDIIIGTHRLVSKDVKFADLGLIIIDEEQKFGVNVKEKLRNLRTQVDTLILTATPIPRTLQFSLLGIRDLSVIQTPPPNRQPIETIVVSGFHPERVRDAVSYELKRGGQVFFIHPRVGDIQEVASGIRKLVPDARIGIAHGQMSGKKLEDAMAGFVEHAYDVLVATKIVESGLDIPNANTILINEADKYGLAELHQMRGRVGRSNRKAFCYLLSPPEISMSEDSRRRMKAMEEFTDLGSGFHIALRDLDIRGAGDLLGPEQSGFIGEIGYDVYHKILDEAVSELKQEHFGELFQQELREGNRALVEDTQIDTDIEARIPSSYIQSTSERLSFYRRIANATDEAQRERIRRELLDRFGSDPEAMRKAGRPVEVLSPVVENLFCLTRIRAMAMRIGIEKINHKRGKLRFFFVGDRESPFYQSPMFQRLIEFVTTFSGRVALKESDKYLSLGYKTEVESLSEVESKMRELFGFVRKEVAVDSMSD